MPATDELQLKVVVCGEPPSVTLRGSVHVNPDGVDVETARVIVPVKPLTAASEIVEVPEASGRICVGETTPAEIEKSTIWKRTVGSVWARLPLVPVTVTM